MAAFYERRGWSRRCGADLDSGGAYFPGVDL